MQSQGEKTESCHRGTVLPYKNLPKSKTSLPFVTSEVTGSLSGTLTDDLDEILTDNTTTLDEILEEEEGIIMTQERSKLTKHRKLEKSFEDLLTGLSDESDDDIDDLVNFDNLPEMCSEDTLIAITKTNKPYTSAATMDDSLKLSDFVDEKTDHNLKEEKKDHKSKQSETNEDIAKHSNLFDDEDDFVSTQSKDMEEKVENDKLIDFDVGMTTETTKIETNDIFEIENQNDNEKLIDFESRETEDDNFRDFDGEKIDYENSSESNDVEDDNERYEGHFTVEDEEKKDNGVELMVTDESGNALDMEQDIQELPVVDSRKREDSIDLDAIVQDNSHLDVDIGIQKVQLRKRGSLAKRRKPSRTSIHSMGGANEDSHFTDSTELKPEMQNGHSDESDVFSRQSSSNDGEATSPPAKKPLPGMVALPGMMGMPVPGQNKKTRGSTPSDSDLTPEDQPQKDFRSMGVKLPIPSSRGSSESEEQTDIRAPVLRKMSDRKPEKPLIENTQQFEKPKLKAVSHSQRDRKESNEDNDSAMFDMPTLKQVEKLPQKSRSSANDSEDMDKHVFQTPKLRRVENAPTESLRFVQGKTGESDDDESLPKSRISDDSRHVFHTPKLKKVDNPPTQTLKLLHGRADEASEAETKFSLGHHNDESSTDDLDIGMYFEKPQLRNVPKATENIRKTNQEKTHFEVPNLKNVPKMELELKSPSASDSDKKFNVPQLKSVQKEKGNDTEDKGEGVFQIPTLRSTPLPKRREPPKSPETKTFDVPILRRTPRVKQETADHVETEKPPTGVFEKPKLKSARSLQQDMDDTESKDSHTKHRFDVPSLRSTPSKKDSSVQKSDVKKTESEKPSWLQETKLRPSHSSSFEMSADNLDDKEKPSWLSESKERDSAKENKNTNSHDYIDNPSRRSSIPLQETRGQQDHAINGHAAPSRRRLESTGSDKDGDNIKGKKETGRDQYVPSWLKTSDTRGKSPSTPNLAFVTPSKDTSEIPQWKRELAEKRKGRKDSDVGLSPRRPESTGEKELPPWKVEMGQKKMRQTPLKAQDTKKSTEPEWKKAAEEKRQRLRSLGDSNYDASGLLSSIKTTK